MTEVVKRMTRMKNGVLEQVNNLFKWHRLLCGETNGARTHFKRSWEHRGSYATERCGIKLVYGSHACGVISTHRKNCFAPHLAFRCLLRPNKLLRIK